MTILLRRDNGMPAALVICEANYQGRILFANQDVEQLYECKDTSSPWMGTKDMNGEYPGPRRPISLHLIKADGSRRKVNTLGRIVYNQHYGEIMFVLMFES